MLGEGFYTLQEAARLIGTSDQRLRAWLKPTERYAAAVKSDRVDGGKAADISFFDLVELNFIEHFRKQDVSLQTLRRVNEMARLEFGPHPFARSGLRFRTDKVRIYSEAAQATGDKVLLDLVERQYQLDVIEQSLARYVDYDPATELARLWTPRSDYTEIVVDPRRNFGRPVLDRFGIGTASIFEQWRAENGDFDAVAEWFEIPTDAVQVAVRFETVALH